MDPDMLAAFGFIGSVLPFVAIIVAVAVGGSLLNNWLKIKNGYPLQNSWGFPIHPKTDQETAERIRLLTGEPSSVRSRTASKRSSGSRPTSPRSCPRKSTRSRSTREAARNEPR